MIPKKLSAAKTPRSQAVGGVAVEAAVKTAIEIIGAGGVAVEAKVDGGVAARAKNDVGAGVQAEAGTGIDITTDAVDQRVVKEGVVVDPGVDMRGMKNQNQGELELQLHQRKRRFLQSYHLKNVMQGQCFVGNSLKEYDPGIWKSSSHQLEKFVMCVS